MEFTDDQLSAWLDEQLPVEMMTQLEQSLRSSEDLQRRVASLIRRRDRGWHSPGDVWRKHQLTCPSRAQLGRWLLGTLPAAEDEYIEFHLQVVGCRYCRANHIDLIESTDDATAIARRRRFFQSSAGKLREHSQSAEESPFADS